MKTFSLLSEDPLDADTVGREQRGGVEHGT